MVVPPFIRNSLYGMYTSTIGLMTHPVAAYAFQTSSSLHLRRSLFLVVQTPRTGVPTRGKVTWRIKPVVKSKLGLCLKNDWQGCYCGMKYIHVWGIHEYFCWMILEKNQMNVDYPWLEVFCWWSLSFYNGISHHLGNMLYFLCHPSNK